MLCFNLKIRRRAVLITLASLILICFLFLSVRLSFRERLPSGESRGDRIAYLYSLGYRPQSEETSKKTAIPDSFSEAFEEYNKIQKEAGFDLEKYKGEEIELFTYKIEENAFVNLIVSKGKIIGGDRFSTYPEYKSEKLNGAKIR